VNLYVLVHHDLLSHPSLTSICLVSALPSPPQDSDVQKQSSDNWQDVCPFEWQSNYHGLKPTDFVIRPDYVFRLLLLLSLLCNNPECDMPDGQLPDGSLKRGVYKFKGSDKTYEADLWNQA
jgi:hypothetical protein